MFPSLNTRIFLLLTFGFGVLAVVSTASMKLPNNHQGYAPVQPIAFSHRLHAGELQLDCLYCHFGARFGRHAGIPPAEICMNCHKTVQAPIEEVQIEKQVAEREGREPRRLLSDELAKLYEALALDVNLEAVPNAVRQPIEWVRVHNLPDFVYFNHSVHVARKVACETCHGPVQSMERVRQESDLSMGWCMDCHRKSGADLKPVSSELGAKEREFSEVSTDCAVCHY